MYVYFGTTAHKNRGKDCIEMFLKVYRFQKSINQSSNRIVETKGLERVNIPLNMLLKRGIHPNYPINKIINSST